MIVFIDAMGTYTCTKSLIDLVIKYSSPNILFVHDYGHPVWKGATRAIDEAKSFYGLNLKVYDTLGELK